MTGRQNLTLHAMIIVGSPWIDIALARGRLAGAIPRLMTICEMYIPDQAQIRPMTILATLNAATAFSVQIPIL